MINFLWTQPLKQNALLHVVKHKFKKLLYTMLL